MFDDEEFPPPPPLPPFRHWLRHVAAVPKGFLRFQVLELLSEKPMSGSEIINEIERRTGGCWKPSPGSVYPLLAWLQDNGYIREVPSEEAGVRRYALTDKGRQLLEEQRKVRCHFRMGRKFFALPLMGGLWLRIPPEKAEEIRESFRRLFKALFSLGLTLEERFSEQALKEALAVLNETAKQLEEIEKRLRGEKA
ncbi:MAG: PadR family transcriptional regulator [Candidatus Bathyarchaeia archaeon]